MITKEQMEKAYQQLTDRQQDHRIVAYNLEQLKAEKDDKLAHALYIAEGEEKLSGKNAEEREIKFKQKYPAIYQELEVHKRAEHEARLHLEWAENQVKMLRACLRIDELQVDKRRET